MKKIRDEKSEQHAAFTLAEVLITLGIIGVVAAMTIPNLVQSYKKKSTVVSIQKFYSVMSQAIKLSEVEHGSVSSWTPPEVGHNGEAMRKWWDTYMKNYFKCKNTTIKNNWFLADLGDGSGVGIKSPGNQTIGLQFFFCVNYKECLDNEFKSSPTSGGVSNPRNSFVFDLNSNGVFQPEGRGNSREILMNSKNYGCNSSTGATAHRYCAALIEYDKWEIKDDYPW